MTEKRLVILVVYVDSDNAKSVGDALHDNLTRWKHQGFPIHSWELGYGAWRDPTKDPPVLPQLMTYYD